MTLDVDEMTINARTPEAITDVSPESIATVAVSSTPQREPLRKVSIGVHDLRREYKVSGEKKGKDKSRKSDGGAGPLVALNGVSLEVYEGELFGLLGPNGAGKTTLIKILTTLLAPTSGTATVAGYDVVRQAQEARRVINMVSGGETSGYGILTVRENLWMFSQFYGVTWTDAHERIDQMLKLVELDDKRETRVSSLSTGQRQRMNFCRGFITDPSIVFLDEPTLGLDVHAARIVRDFTRDWIRQNPQRTVLLTTHYMAEADEMCDRIAIIDHGKVLACDTPSNLKRMLQRQPVFEFTVSGLTPATLAALQGTPGVAHATSEPDSTGVTHKLKLILEEEPAIGAAVSVLTAANAGILSLQKHEPSLEDVFVKLVGRSLTGEDETNS